MQRAGRFINSTPHRQPPALLRCAASRPLCRCPAEPRCLPSLTGSHRATKPPRPPPVPACLQFVILRNIPTHPTWPQRGAPPTTKRASSARYNASSTPSPPVRTSDCPTTTSPALSSASLPTPNELVRPATAARYVPARQSQTRPTALQTPNCAPASCVGLHARSLSLLLPAMLAPGLPWRASCLKDPHNATARREPSTATTTGQRLRMRLICLCKINPTLC